MQGVSRECLQGWTFASHHITLPGVVVWPVVAHFCELALLIVFYFNSAQPSALLVQQLKDHSAVSSFDPTDLRATWSSTCMRWKLAFAVAERPALHIA